jgi:hypothetical protein
VHSGAPVSGAQYRKSIFSSHAPEVLKWLRAFDAELAEALGPADDGPASGFDTAIVRLQERLKRLS